MDNFFVDFAVSVKVVRPVCMCLNETCREVHIGKYLSDACNVENDISTGVR
jgi:hypothetical protein